MNYPIGILFAFGAFLFWGFGDFFIQRTTRLIGTWKALFFIAITATIGLFPFVFDDLQHLSGENVALLSLVSIVVMGAALFDFEALRQGKIAIIEPIISLELPITVGLSMMLANESLSLAQILVILFIFLGILLAITAHRPNFRQKKIVLEKGVILALIGAIGLALNNFLVGFSSQINSPLLTLWFANTAVTLVCIVYLFFGVKKFNPLRDLKKHPFPIIAQSVLDNLAWVSYAVSTSLIPIAITTTISESYIVLAVILGVYINKEKLKKHQFVGAGLAILGVIALSLISG